MKFHIITMNDNCSGMTRHTKKDFLEEISLMIDNCIANGGKGFYVDVYTDASCLYCDDDEND